MDQRFTNRRVVPGLVALCAWLVFANAAYANNDVLTAKREWNFETFKMALYHSFGIEPPAASDDATTLSGEIQKSIDSMTSSVDKVEDLERQMIERQDKMEQQMYGTEPSK